MGVAIFSNRLPRSPNSHIIQTVRTAIFKAPHPLAAFRKPSDLLCIIKLCDCDCGMACPKTIILHRNIVRISHVYSSVIAGSDLVELSPSVCLCCCVIHVII